MTTVYLDGIEQFGPTINITGTSPTITTDAGVDLQIIPGGITRFGGEATSHSLTDDGDIVAKNIEANGVLYGDNGVKIPSNKFMSYGSADNTISGWNTDQTVDCFIWWTDATSHTWMLSSALDFGTDYGFGSQTNPTTVWQSNDATTPAKRGYLTHNETDFVINQDTGTTKTAGGRSVNVTTVSSATHTLAISDDIVHVSYTASGAVTITLPTAQATAGRIFEIVDGGGNSSANNITVNTEGSETISGAANLTINADYTAVSFYSVGGNWFIH
jgi:hypothetical protein